MKIKRRYNYKFLGEFKNIILQHINANIKDYLMLSIFFIIGVMAGVVIINNSNAESKKEISGYVNSFISSIKDEQYKVDTVKLTKMSIIDNMKTVGVMWLAGTTIIGIPLIFIVICYKGFCLGYTVSAIISSLGVWKRYYFFISFIAITEYCCYSSNINA
jgi:stage II sporulation protein M